MSTALRRLAKEHAALQEELPPYYILPEDDVSLPDDLTQLIVLVTGPDGTAFSNGLWRLCLKVPIDYPKSPPRAFFKTKIFHPNVEESTGAVCLETLKAGWQPTFTLKEILVHISCLLIQPNPDSALNATAGALIREDYGAFCKQAQLLTSIHAPIPKAMVRAVFQAKRGRTEESCDVVTGEVQTRDPSNASTTAPQPTQGILIQNPQKSTLGKRIWTKVSMEELGDLTQSDRKSSVEPGPLRKSPKRSHDNVSIQAVDSVKTLAHDVDDRNGHIVLLKLSSDISTKASSATTNRKVSKGGPRVGIRRL